MTKNKASLAVSAISVLWIGLLIFLPTTVLGSFVVTLALAIVVFAKIERDKNRHDREFYFRGTPSESTIKWLRRIGNTEIVGRGLLLAATSLLLFRGTEPTRVMTNRASFFVCTVLAYLIIRHLDRRSNFDALRWGYVKLSLMVGIIISLPVGMTSPIGLVETAGRMVKILSPFTSVDDVVEVVSSLSAYLNNTIRWVIQKAVGDFLGYVISMALSTNVVYGFIVVLYASALHLAVKWLLRPNFEEGSAAKIGEA